MWAIDAERVREVVPDAASGASWSGESTFLEPLMKHVAQGMRVLDLGCGAGRFARHVAPVVQHLVCVDSSPMLLAEARTQLNDYNNVAYVRNQAWTLTVIADSSIDLVFSQGLFGFIGPREFVAFAAEARRVLRPDGVFLFSAYTFDDRRPTDRIPSSLRRLTEPGRLHSGLPEPYTRDYVVALLHLVGLEMSDTMETTVDPTNGYSIFASRPEALVSGSGNVASPARQAGRR